MLGPHDSPLRSRRWLLERLETRDAPAIVSFRAGGSNFTVHDVAISNQSPSQSFPSEPTLQAQGKAGSANHSQILLRFDNLIGTGPGQIPPQATIVHANLVFWATDGSSTTAKVNLNRLLQPWDPNTTTWDSWTNGIELNNVEAVEFADAVAAFGPHGYQATGHDLKQSLQSWADGEANYGWVITVDDSQGFWAMASSEATEAARRPCLNVEFTAPGFTNPSYVALAGAPPLATTMAWLEWNNNLRNQRVARVPLDRPTTFYFSQSGDDATGLGTIDSPWKSLAKAYEVLQESGGQGLRLRFQRGDVWNEETHFWLGHHVSGFTMDDYGDAAAPKPVLSRFLPLDGAGWQHVSGNLYKYVFPEPVGWLREAADGFTRVYYRAASSAEVAQRQQSWFYDPGGVDPASGGIPSLYLNCGQDPTLVTGGFETCPNDGIGWEMRGDNIRLQNLRLEGYGVSKSGQSYGLKIVHETALREFVAIGVDVYYAGYHAFGHIVQYVGSKGAATLIDCSGGLCVNRDGNGNPGSGDTTTYVAYGDYGGNEYISYNCEAKYGTLPSADWAATPGAAHGAAFYCHVGLSGTLDLVIMQKTRTGDFGYPVRARNAFDSLPAASNLSQVRGFLVEEGTGPGYSRYIGSDLAVINSVFDYTDPPRDLDYHYAFNYNAVSKGWLINCTITIDAVNQTSFYFFVMHSVYLNRVRAYHCHIDIFNAERPLYWDVPFASGPIYINAELTNSIVSFSTTASSGLGMPNDANVLRSNAYFLPNLVVPEWGYSNDAGRVTLSRRYPTGLRPTTSSPLYNGGVANVVEYYQDGTPRGSISTIGPLAGIAMPMPTAVAAHWGHRNMPLVGTTHLWSPDINRFTAEFASDVDIGIGALELRDANGPRPWAGMSYNPTTLTAEWTLTEPLPTGTYTLYFDGQPIRTITVLPGDFTSNGAVSAQDFAVFRQNYGTEEFVGDLDGDGYVTAVDFNRFRQFYGLTL